jgi:hypothetical protein
VYVLDKQNKPLPRISAQDAAWFCSRGWARYEGHGTKVHLRMLIEVPQRSRRSPGTRPIRGDKTTLIRGDGQLMGNPQYLREFIPTDN